MILDRVKTEYNYSITALSNTIEVVLNLQYPVFINFAYVQISTDATVGNREFSMEILDAATSATLLPMTSGGSQGASIPGLRYAWFNGSAYPGDAGAPFLTNKYYTPIPPSAIIEPGGKIKFYDINNISGGDAMNIRVNYLATN